MQRDDLKQFNIPDEPGIYMFRGGTPKRPGKILYIGKAASLRDRVRSYFAHDLAESRNPAIAAMVQRATSLTFRTTDSVLEALILEANLIKRHEPQYNVDEKDNKSFNYLVVTKEEYPKFLVVRGRELFQHWTDAKILKLFGPFPQGGSLQEALRITRKIFPYRDEKCTPCDEQKRNGRANCRPCFNRQIGLCPGVCTGEISNAEYRAIVRHLCQMFSGNFKGLKRQLAREMKAFAKEELFEKASRIRRQIAALEHIKDVSLIKDERRHSAGGLVRSGKTRIEAFDVAHTAGKETVAVMTVVEDGAAKKSDYRKFRIRTATNDDVASLREALTRRLNHPEWPLPRAFAIDGGKGQVRAIERVLADAGIMIPVIGVVKNDRHQVDRLLGNPAVAREFERDILLANSEAHRFGIGYHRKRRARIF